MLRAFPTITAACVVLGCATAGVAVSHPVVVQVDIGGPAIVGFFPPVTEEEIASQPGVREGIAHLEFAIADAKQCLAPRTVQVEGVLAEVLILQTPTQRHRILLPTDWEHAVGAYIIEPGRPPVVVYATMGPSSLLQALPNAVAEYFSEPNCIFEL